MEPKLPNDARQTNWVNISIKAVILFAILVFSNFLIVTIFGSSIWLNASYFFGSNIQSTLGTLFFIEGGIFTALGSLWSFGSSENVSYGIYRKTYGSFSEKDWKNRMKLTDKPGETIRILLIIGGLTLITAFVTIMI